MCSDQVRGGYNQSINIQKNHNLYIRLLPDNTRIEALTVKFLKKSHVCKYIYICHILGFPDSLDGKEAVCNAGDPGSISGLGRSPGE